MSQSTDQETTEYYFVLKPSPIAGIGVFAAQDISAGTHLFRGNHSSRKMKTKDVPSEFIKYCIFLNDEESHCPERFDRMEIGWYINHSEHPNIGKDTERRVVALRDIRTGEEIVLDYNHLNEPEHLKEAYYKRN